MDMRRLRLLPLSIYKIKYLWYLVVKKKDLANAWSYIWATLFTRDAGLALFDPLIRLFPWLASYPKQMEIEVTTHCHLKCRMCEHTYWDESPRHMTFDEFKHIVDQFPNLHWIGMTGIGSSFLNKDYMKMVRYMKRGKKAFVEFFDHFYLLHEGVAAEIIELGVNKVWISLENAKAETYNAARCGSDFDTVLKNIWNFVKLKKTMRSPIPELWFHFIITRENIGEMKEYVDLVSQFADYERGFSAPVIYWTNMLAFDAVADLAIRPENAWIEEIKAYCRKKRIFYVFNENVQCDKKMSQCVKWTEPFILVSGHVQPCCALNEANTRIWQKEHAFMNIMEENFRDWWDSPVRKKFINTIRSGGINDICRYCHIYQHPQNHRFHADNNIIIK